MTEIMILTGERPQAQGLALDGFSVCGFCPFHEILRRKPGAMTSVKEFLSDVRYLRIAHVEYETDRRSALPS